MSECDKWGFLRVFYLLTNIYFRYVRVTLYTYICVCISHKEVVISLIKEKLLSLQSLSAIIVLLWSGICRAVACKSHDAHRVLHLLLLFLLSLELEYWNYGALNYMWHYTLLLNVSFTSHWFWLLVIVIINDTNNSIIKHIHRMFALKVYIFVYFCLWWSILSYYVLCCTEHYICGALLRGATDDRRGHQQTVCTTLSFNTFFRIARNAYLV